MALSKQEKETILAQYQEWLDKSVALVLVEYTGVNMNALDLIRSKVREAGGEFHVLKNTLAKRALDAAGMPVEPDYLENSTAVGFAFADAAGVAKALAEFDKSMDAVKIKGGYLGKQVLSISDVKALADLPPLPVVRAKLLGTILAPAGKLARTLAEPGRQVAAVINAFAEKNAASVAA
ncbi:MAG TPA: 50S ribosomal protein L10 [Anaerolineae bacterium]|nr:50S ribosomal protein L10 [Anaerolineae bacterium]